jgi:hypothetical protein
MNMLKLQFYNKYPLKSFSEETMNLNPQLTQKKDEKKLNTVIMENEMWMLDDKNT